MTASPTGPRAGRSGPGPFSRRTVVALVGVGVGTFALGLFLAAYAGDLFGAASAGHDSYSRSLVGYRALRAVLERSGLSVVVARTDAGRRVRDGAPLLLLEPLATDGQEPFAPPPRLPDGPGRLRRALEQAWAEDASVVLVLPKWAVDASPRHPGWIESMALAPPATPAEVLAIALGDGATAVEEGGAADTIVRPDRAAPFRHESGEGAPADVDLGERPQLVAPDAGLAPVVANDDGVLVGRWWPPEGYGELVVIADPDLLNNRGLPRAGNAAVVLDLLRAAYRAHAVVVDETLHGHTSADSIVGRALRFPLVLLVVHGALAVALLGWSVATRFGRPLAPPPALPPGKRLLIDNTAALLQSAGDHGEAVRRYLRLTEARVARRFSVPEGTAEDALRERLARLNRARGVTFDRDAVAAAAAADRVTAPEARRLARRVHAWERSLLGTAPPPSDPRHRLRRST